MKLLEAVSIVEITDKKLLERIYYVLEDRKDTLECQEPIGSSDFFYEKWEEKFDEFSSIFDDYTSIIEELGIIDGDDDVELSEDDVNRLTKELDDVKLNLEAYQFEYGGLKRLTV